MLAAKVNSESYGDNYYMTARSPPHLSHSRCKHLHLRCYDAHTPEGHARKRLLRAVMGIVAKIASCSVGMILMMLHCAKDNAASLGRKIRYLGELGRYSFREVDHCTKRAWPRSAHAVRSMKVRCEQ